MSFEQRGVSRPSPARPSLDHVDRQQKRAVLRLSDGLVVEGILHLPPGVRALDFLNRPTETFVALTEATLHVGGQTEQTPFLAVNKAHIVSVRDIYGESASGRPSPGS